MPLIGPFTPIPLPPVETIGDPDDYNDRFETIRAAIDDSLVMTDVARDIEAQHTFNPDGAPFILGPNAQNQTIVGLAGGNIRGVPPIVVVAAEFRPSGYLVDLSAIDSTSIPVYMPVDGFMGVPHASYLAAADSGTATTRFFISTSSGGTGQELTANPLTIDGGEFNSLTAAGGDHTFGGVNQADSQVSAGDVVFVRLVSINPANGNDDGDGLTVQIPIYGSNPYI